MTPLDYVADRQAVWSQTANMLKKRTDKVRRTVFSLSLAGAILAAIATQLPSDTGLARWAATIAGAVALTGAAFLSQRFLRKEAIGRHLRARAASEALKREAYLYATRVGGYADAAARDALLVEKQRKIEDNINDLAREEQGAAGPGSSPRLQLTRDEYAAQRIAKQIEWYRSRATSYAAVADKLHMAEWVLALAAAIITASAGILGKVQGFDLAAVTAVLTTLGATIVAHLNATRYDDLVINYRAAARRLEQLMQTAPAGQPVGEFAAAAEAILEAENNAWVAVYTVAAAS
jgi:hypothetical protein